MQCEEGAVETVTKRVDVAVAVIFNSEGDVLWACRPAGKPYAGYWEFPGGKVECGETIWQALVRELREELGIEALEGGAWFFVEHDYPHAQVRLHFYRVWLFDGVPSALEGQRLRWAALSVEADDSELKPILPATQPLLPALAQPVRMAVTGYGLDWAACIARLEAVLPNDGPWYVQFREKSLVGERLLLAFRHCEDLCRRFGHVLLVNSDGWERLCAALDGVVPDGVFVHLTERDLRDRPACLSGLPVLGASVHGAEGLLCASQQGLRYTVLGAVKETPSHAGEVGMGWEAFERLVLAHARLPVFAIGGLSPQDLNVARSHGAHGVAMLSRLSV